MGIIRTHLKVFYNTYTNKMKQNRPIKGFFSRVTVMLALMLFTATAAVADDFGQQVLDGSLNQTVYAGEEIELTKILYDIDNDQLSIVSDAEITDLGLSVHLLGAVLTISGNINPSTKPGTYKASVTVKDKNGRMAETVFTFEVKEMVFLAWNPTSGNRYQSVKAGEPITPIVFDCVAIQGGDVSGLPSGLEKSVDLDNNKIIISGTIDKKVIADDYTFQVTVKDIKMNKHVLLGTFSVEGDPTVTGIRVKENGVQKAHPGSAIKPIVFKYQNATDFIVEGLQRGTFTQTNNSEKHELTIEGSFNEGLNGFYSITVTAMNGTVKSEAAKATVDVTYEPIVTRVVCIENESQTVYAGGQMKPIVFVVENAIDVSYSNFPGGYEARRNGDTISIYTCYIIENGTKGLHQFRVSAIGPENQGEAIANLYVIPSPADFYLDEGSDNQEVAAGNTITPVVYQCDHVKSVECTGLPLGLKGERHVIHEYNEFYEFTTNINQYIISGTVAPGAEAKEYTYTITATDYYGDVTTSTGKIKVVAPSVISGDANGDGDITMADANMVVNYFLAADKSKVSDIYISAADINHDGSITMADANQIVNMFLSNGK